MQIEISVQPVDWQSVLIHTQESTNPCEPPVNDGGGGGGTTTPAEPDPHGDGNGGKD